MNTYRFQITRIKIKGVQAQALYYKFIIMLKRWWINRNVPSAKEQIHELGDFLMNEVDEWPPTGGAVELAIEIIRDRDQTISSLRGQISDLVEEAAEHKEDKINASMDATYTADKNA